MNYITNFPRDDGFGAQYQTILFTIMYCGFTNNFFAYSPFAQIAHNYDNDKQFIVNKERLINLIGNFPLSSEVKCSVASSNIYNVVESNLDSCLLSSEFQKAKRLFFENKTFNNLHLTVAVHIRVVNTCDIGDYGYVGYDYFLNKINLIRKSHSSALFHIYSQGDINDFREFISDDVIFHLNESVESTFTALASADILIMSKSSFSYCAALLSDGEVHYLPFWHKKASHWI